MSETSILIASARVLLSDPNTVLEKMCEHFVEHGTVTMTERGGRIESPFGCAVLEADAGALSLRAESPDEASLFIVKSSLAEHIFMFAENETPEFVWTGDNAASAEIPYFREMVVRGSRQIALNMRRVTLAGDVAHFAKGGLHARVVIPPKGRAPVWPTAGADGRVTWPKGEDELAARVYTIRAIDEARGELDLDVVLHGSSAGSIWAQTAQPGDVVGLMGPGGGEVVQAATYVLAGDETALPVIARMAEELPPEARVTILLEAAGPDEELPISSRAHIDLRWLHRDGAAPGTTDLLERAMRALEWPDDAPPYVLVGCEHKAAKAIRAHLRKERGLARENHLVAAYWRRGYQDAAHDDDHH